PTALLCILTAVLGLLARALCLLPALLWRDVIVQHGDSSLSDRANAGESTVQRVPFRRDSAYQTTPHERCSQSDIDTFVREDAPCRGRPARGSRSVVQDDRQVGAVDREAAGVLDEPELQKLVDEVVHVRTM